MITSTSSNAIACAARSVTSSIGPPASYIDNSISRPRIPPRLFVSDTASSTLLVDAGPQIPGEPEKVRKLPTRSLLRAPPRLEKSLSIGSRARPGGRRELLLYTSDAADEED